jgi:predicted nucleic acid-binding protein
MIVLDTNVLSELIAPRPDESVAQWFRYLPSDASYTTTVTEAEMRYGAAKLAAGKRRSDLETVLNKLFAVRFAGRVLAFDRAAANVFADIVLRRQRQGHGYVYPDAQIVAIALSLGATVATRNVSDFEYCGVGLVDPWNPTERE